MCDEGVRARLAAQHGTVAATPAGQRERKRKQYDRKRSSAKRKRSRANAPAAAVPPTADAQGCDRSGDGGGGDARAGGQAISPAHARCVTLLRAERSRVRSLNRQRAKARERVQRG